MRKISFFLVLPLLFTFLQAQNTPGISVDSMLANVDKSSFTSGVLYDRVSGLSRLFDFNDSVNISNKKYFEQALLELYRASHGSSLISHKDLRKLYTPDSLQHVVDIGVINANFHTVNYNPDNESSGALTISGDKFELLNNGKLPFEPRHVFIVAPLKLYVVGETVVFKFRPEMILQSAQGRELVNLTINPDATTDYIIVQGGVITTEEITINYQESGYKRLLFNAEFEDGSTIQTEGVLHINIAVTPPAPLVVDGITNATIAFKGYDEPNALLGKLEYRIFFGNPQGKLMKPIIIIDGFDPQDKRKIQDSDPHPGQSNEAHRSIEEMMVYYEPGNPNPVQIIPELRAMGYDVIIVNHPTYSRNGIVIDGGADYIERNALTHVQLYQELNAELVQNNSSEQLVIVGPSMGGQISRYALAYMEANSVPHNVRLWVSVDSPHLGANIPIGAQTLLNLINDHGDSVQAEDFVENQLGSAAAKQQLIEQHKQEYTTAPPFNFPIPLEQMGQQYLNSKTISQGFNQTRGHPFFVQYYNNLFNNGLSGSNGYPQNPRSIAIANGSLTKSKQFENPYVAGGTALSGTAVVDTYAGNVSKVLKIKGYANIIGNVTTLESYFMPGPTSNHKIAYFKKRNFLGTDFYDRYITNNNSRGCLDNVPGGWYPTQRDLAFEIENSENCEWFIGQICINDWIINTLEHVSSFIPTVSALGFSNPDFNWNHNMDRDLTCTGEIPFDSYFGPQLNEQHTSFTEASINWLYAELDGNPQPPTVYLNNGELMGPGVICSGDTVTYDFDLCRSPAVEEWQVSNNLQIITSDAQSVTVEPANANAGGEAHITAIYVNHSITKNLWIGKPASASGISGPTEVDTGSMVSYHGTGAQGATSFKWWLPYPFDENVDVRNPIDFTSDNWQTWPDQGYHNYKVFTGLGGHDGLVQFFGVNSCGEGGSFHINVEHTNNGGVYYLLRSGCPLSECGGLLLQPGF